MANVLQVKRSSLAGKRPAEGKPGEIYINFADRRLGYIDAAATPVDIVQTLPVKTRAGTVTQVTLT